MTAKAGGTSPPRGLAKGLSALLADGGTLTATPGVAPTLVPIEFLKPSALQPRRRFDKAALEALAESIRSKGILQPLIVRADSRDPGSYEIIAGERRWRAAQIAKIHEVPIVIHLLSDREALEIGLIENVQRTDLTPMEEAAAYRRLIDEFDHSQEETAKIIGKSRSHIANTLRLLGLPEAVRAMIDSGTLSAGHGRALLAADEEDRIKRAEQVVAQGFSVRQTEALMRKAAPGGGGGKPSRIEDADTRALEKRLSDLLDLPVGISHRGPGGTILLRYESFAQLDHLLRRLGMGE